MYIFKYRDATYYIIVNNIASMCVFKQLTEISIGSGLVNYAFDEREVTEDIWVVKIQYIGNTSVVFQFSTQEEAEKLAQDIYTMYK